MARGCHLVHCRELNVSGLCRADSIAPSNEIMTLWIICRQRWQHPVNCEHLLITCVQCAPPWLTPALASLGTTQNRTCACSQTWCNTMWPSQNADSAVKWWWIVHTYHYCHLLTACCFSQILDHTLKLNYYRKPSYKGNPLEFEQNVWWATASAINC